MFFYAKNNVQMGGKRMNEAKLYKKTKKLLLAWGVTEDEAENFIKNLADTADEGEETETADEKEIEKAEEDIKEDGANEQTERDHIDESVGEQEREDDKEDSQTAKDRVDESIGTEEADEERAEEEHEEKEENHLEGIGAKLDNLIEMVTALVTSLTKEKGGDEAALEEAKKRYGVGSGVVEQGDPEKSNGITHKEAFDVMKKLRG